LLTVFLIAHLAGRAAEEEILGSATSNSGGSEQSDLALATGLALEMETVLGFSRKWPLLYRKPRDGVAILSTDLELAQRVHARLASAHKAARDIVRNQKTALQFLANILLAEETLEGPDLDAVLEQVRQKMVDLPARR
jgi:cell division protease FtsH